MIKNGEERKEKYVVEKGDLEIVKKVSLKLFKLIGIESKPKVKTDKTDEAIVVSIDSENEAGLLIGPRGETINSLQMIIAMMARKSADKWIRVLVDVADWREKQTSKLESLAIQTAERALSIGEAQSLYNLNATQRRVVHMALVDNKDVETESLGEGADRYLVVKPKQSS